MSVPIVETYINLYEQANRKIFLAVQRMYQFRWPNLGPLKCSTRLRSSLSLSAKRLPGCNRQGMSDEDPSSDSFESESDDGGTQLDICRSLDEDSVVRSSRRYLAQLLAGVLGKHDDFYYQQLEYDETHKSTTERAVIKQDLRNKLRSDDQMRGRLLKLVDMDAKFGDRRFQLNCVMDPVISGGKEHDPDQKICPHCLLAGELVQGDDLHRHLWTGNGICGPLTQMTGIFVRDFWLKKVHPNMHTHADPQGGWSYKYAKINPKYWGSVNDVLRKKFTAEDLFFGMGLYIVRGP